MVWGCCVFVVAWRFVVLWLLMCSVCLHVVACCLMCVLNVGCCVLFVVLFDVYCSL